MAFFSDLVNDYISFTASRSSDAMGSSKVIWTTRLWTRCSIPDGGTSDRDSVLEIGRSVG